MTREQCLSLQRDSFSALLRRSENKQQRDLMRWKEELKAEAIRTRKPKSHGRRDNTRAERYLYQKGGRTGGGKGRENKGRRHQEAEWKKVILGE